MIEPSKIFVFCNSCSPGWHSAIALAEDGTALAGHICSAHGWIPHDMGLTSDWKHEVYKKHYPEGWGLVLVEPVDDPLKHPGAAAAIARNQAGQP